MAYSHEHLGLCLGVAYKNAPGIETKDGYLTAWPQELLGPLPADEELEAIVNKELPLIQYKELRAKNYPDIREQLDLIFHEGLEGWKAVIQEVKNKYPKPEA